MFDFLVGVPDSTLAGLGGIIAANEGNAIGLAVGYHLATGKTPVVYMQNSGLWNAMNPITSLVIPYRIPMTLLISDRGGLPQHEVDFRTSIDALMSTGFSLFHIDTKKDLFDVSEEEKGKLSVVIIPDEMFKTDQSENTDREKTIERILAEAPPDSVFVSATGKISRELYELRGDRHEKDFLCIGGMGHCLQVAAGIAMQRPNRQVICLDGDGSVLMHLGGLAVVAQMGLQNLTHIMLNNGAHDSVGGSPTVALDLDFKQITEGMGYKYSRKPKFGDGPWFCEEFVSQGARADLVRPEDLSKESFMEYLNEDSHSSL
jgi:phosphonopyruvate decarboxylase